MSDNQKGQVELLPCPFCAQPAKHEVWSLHKYHRVWCGNCDVEMDYFDSLEDAALRWNTRGGSEVPVVLVPERVMLAVATGWRREASGARVGRKVLTACAEALEGAVAASRPEPRR